VTPALSILIPTIGSRSSLLSRLLWTLEPQLDPRVEVIIHQSETLPMGEKFNELYAMANGRFGVIFDDDDTVVANYVETVLQHVSDDVDYIGYKVLYTINGAYCRVFASDPRTAIYQHYQLDVTTRHVMHKCPIDVEHARKYRFGLSYDADYAWVGKLISNGYPFNPVVLDAVLYHYDYWPRHTIGAYPDLAPPQRDVGTWPYDRDRFTWVGGCRRS
jgi:hypothetical protein